MRVKKRFLATGIGSMPFTDVQHAVDISLSKAGEAPFWPQLPNLGINEQMEVQYSEGMPRIVIDRDNERMYFDTSGDYSEEFARFYEAYVAAMDPDGGNGKFDAVAMTPEFAKGLYAFENSLRARSDKLMYVKVQTTGPCTFALSTVDENKRASYYNEEFRDIVTKVLAMKCRWQIQKFQPYAQEVICFIDEPILAGFGSSTYVSVKRSEVINYINELVQAIHMDNGIAAIHCCGNTEWSMVIESGVDIVNFDAFEYGETIAMYPEAVKSFLEGGGQLAWGIVPTSEAIREHTPETLVERLEKLVDHLASKGVDKELILNRALITPSCGTGSMSTENAEKVFDALPKVSEAMREKYGVTEETP